MTTLSELKQFYQENPRYFAEAERTAAEGQLLPSHSEIHKRVREMDGKVVCDFGCGTGKDIEAMYNPANIYIGLDISQGALDAAKRRFGKENITYLQADFESTVPLADGSCDVVTSFFVLEHLPDPTKALEEIVRILKPGGRLFLIAPNYGSPLKSAPPLGTPSKVKLMVKSIRLAKTAVRRLVFPRSALDFKMIPLEKIDLSGTWGADMDATNEPWAWEVARFLQERGMKFVSVSTWEGVFKTTPEKVLSKIGGSPLVRYWGPICHIMAVKI